jgi:hypothetical protein
MFKPFKIIFVDRFRVFKVKKILREIYLILVRTLFFNFDFLKQFRRQGAGGRFAYSRTFKPFKTIFADRRSIFRIEY